MGRAGIILNHVLLCSVLFLVNVAHAGGMVFPIVITDIHSHSRSHHVIAFTLAQKVGYDYPLDTCPEVFLTIHHSEWQFDHKLIFFIKNLISFNQQKRRLNHTIATLKSQIHEPFLLSDVEAFQYDPSNPCAIVAKDIGLLPNIPFAIDGTAQKMTLIQPSRHVSDVKHMPKFIQINAQTALK